MNDSRKIQMHLNIGGQQISLKVDAGRRTFVRDVETEIDGLYSRWRKAFPAKPDREILAMVAYQYASFYSELRQEYESAARITGDCLSLLGKGPTDETDEDA